MDFSPGAPSETMIFEAVNTARGDTAAERLLSRQGLSDIHAVLTTIPFVDGQDATAVIEGAKAGEAMALEAISIYSGLLGAFACDIALAFAARGGVFINSALVEAIGDFLDVDAFQQRFRSKGLMCGYMDGIPAKLMTGRPVLLGLSSLFSPSDRVFQGADIKYLDC